MNLALILLKTGQTLISQTEQMEYEPKVHLLNPMTVSGKTKVTLAKWPEHAADDHVLLTSDALLTVCEPTDSLRTAYMKKQGLKEEDLVVKPKPELLTEDENRPEQDDEYEPRYIEEPVY